MFEPENPSIAPSPAVVLHCPRTTVAYRLRALTNGLTKKGMIASSMAPQRSLEESGSPGWD